MLALVRLTESALDDVAVSCRIAPPGRACKLETERTGWMWVHVPQATPRLRRRSSSEGGIPAPISLSIGKSHVLVPVTLQAVTGNVRGFGCNQ
jgi:hypothetical protein